MLSSQYGFELVRSLSRYGRHQERLYKLQFVEGKKTQLRNYYQ